MALSDATVMVHRSSLPYWTEKHVPVSVMTHAPDGSVSVIVNNDSCVAVVTAPVVAVLDGCTNAGATVVMMVVAVVGGTVGAPLVDGRTVGVDVGESVLAQTVKVLYETEESENQ